MIPKRTLFMRAVYGPAKTFPALPAAYRAPMVGNAVLSAANLLEERRVHSFVSTLSSFVPCTPNAQTTLATRSRTRPPTRATAPSPHPAWRAIAPARPPLPVLAVEPRPFQLLPRTRAPRDN